MAFAAVISLQHTIERLHIPIPQIINPASKELDSLRYMLEKLDGERSRNIDRSEFNALDAQIRDAVWKVEDVLESYQLSQGVVDDKGLENEIGSFLAVAERLKVEYHRALEDREDIIEDDADAVSTMLNNSTTVGLSHLSREIMFDQLLDWTTKRKIVSIVGMAGIGKTHLTLDIYHHPLILQHFELRVWVRVGPEYKDPMNILVDILTQIECKPRDVFKNESLDALEHLLRNILLGRRYLVVLDDIWTTVVLNDCIRCIPANSNGSRFLLTTRLLDIADQHKMYQMPFLNREESWILLYQNVFADESSIAHQLEKTGRKIAKNCEGLPLLILAVANILCGHEKTEEYWLKVAEKRTPTFTDAYGTIYEVLLSSYEYLPQYLKPCFLYMGVFPQSREIFLSKLTNFWIVEDFLQLSLSQNLEVFAMECMQDLVSHNLAIVCKRRFNRIKSAKLHSAYWHLCVAEAMKNKFFHVLNKLPDVFIESSRRLSIQNSMLIGTKEVYDSMCETSSTTRSLLCTGEDHHYQVRICFDVMILIKVLDVLAIRFYEFPNEVVELLQLRYLSLTHNGEVPSSISDLQQLEWLILHQHHNIKMQRDSAAYLPGEIWDMKKLRHLRIMGSKLPDPSKGAELPNLSTLYVNAESCTKDVFRSIPNIKKLGIRIELEPGRGAVTLRCLEHIGVLTKLKALKCGVVNPRLRSRFVVAPAEHLSHLPVCLEKLSLNGLGYSWNDMSSIASLPNLKELKLQSSAFQGPEWETKAVGQFPRLTFLLLEDMDLVHWTAEQKQDYFGLDGSFRSLRYLIVRHCYNMKKIPWNVLPLERTELVECIPSLMDSLQQMRDKARQSSYARNYYDLKAVITSSWHL